jgi:hypothetical protein
VASLGATVTPVEFWNHVYIATFADAKDVATFGPSLASTVDFAYPLTVKQQTPKLVPNDTLFPDQWHLRNTGQNGGTPGADVDGNGFVDATDLDAARTNKGRRA